MNQGGEVLGGEEVFGAGKLYKENVADKGTSDQKGGQNGQNCDFIGLFFGFWGWLPWSGFDHLWRRVWGGWRRCGGKVLRRKGVDGIHRESVAKSQT